MERTRYKAKVEKAEQNWKRLQEEELKNSTIEITAKLEKVVITKDDSQAEQLKDIA